MDSYIDNPKVLNYVVTLIVAIFLALTGFYFGIKYEKSNNLAQASNFNNTIQGVKEVRDQIKTKSSPTPTNPILELTFLEAKDLGKCPENYNVKAKIDGQTKKYYLKSNKFYNRVKAKFCFVAEKDALKHGFVKQY